MTCQHCGTPLHKRRPAKFCGGACRAAWHRHNRAHRLEASLLAARAAIDIALVELRKAREVSP